MTRDPLGARGDFITAPEISQMFGEIDRAVGGRGLAADGRAGDVRLVELGPGRGTMMVDALRAAQVVPEFRAAVVCIWSRSARRWQAQQQRSCRRCAMPVHWHRALDEVPEGPAIVIANEFFDALPVHQAVKSDDGWHERLVEIDADGKLAFSIARDPIPLFDRCCRRRLRNAPDGSIFEWRADKWRWRSAAASRDDGGAALVIDYGHAESAAGDTLQAVGRHAYADPLEAPGSVDLTAHVDFEALARAVEAMGAPATAPVTQAQFLRRLGIETRAAALKANGRRDARRRDRRRAEAADRRRRPHRHGRRCSRSSASRIPKLGALPGFRVDGAIGMLQAASALRRLAGIRHALLHARRRRVAGRL